MLRLALNTARHRVAALLAIACATLVGAALLTGVGVLVESGLRSPVPTDRFASAGVLVSAEQTVPVDGLMSIPLPERSRVPADLADTLSRLPGVTAAVGDLSFPAAVVDARGAVVPSGDPAAAGHGWASTALLDHPGITGSAPAGPGEVALGADTAAAAGVRPGDRLSVTAAGHPADYRVSAVITGTKTTGIFFSDTTAAYLGGYDQGSGTADLVALRTAPGAEAAVAAAVRSSPGTTKLLVSTGADRGDVEDLGAAAARSMLPQLTLSLAGITLLIIGFIVGGALAVSIGAQRRELALMRAVGATPRQIRRLAAGQASVIALPASLLGAAGGYLLAEQFRRLLASIGLLPADLSLTVSPFPAIAAVLLLAVVVQVAARCAAWRTSRLPATEAVAESRSEPRSPSKTRTRAGVLVIVASVVCSVAPLLSRSQLGGSVTALAGILGAIGLALAGPALVGRVSRGLARRLPARASAPSWLAVANSHGYALRVAGAVTTLAMAVVFVLTYTLTQTTIVAATADDVSAADHAQGSVSAPALGGVPDGTLAAVAATPGVRAAAPVSSTTVLWSYRFAGDTEVDSSSALVLTPAASGVLDLGVRTGTLAGLTGNTVAVSADTAGSREASVGSEVSLILGDGTPVRARVVATYARGLGFGPLVLSRDLVAGHTAAGLDQHILIGTDGTDQTGHRLAALAAARPGVVVDPDGASAVLGGTGSVPPELWVNIAVLAVLLGYLLLGIANKLVATTAQRRGEIATLRLLGTTARQIRAMMRREAAIVCAFALTAGVLLSAVPLGLLSFGFLTTPWPAGPVWLLPLVVVVIALITFLATELPTRSALATPPLDARTQRA
jgi:putative ABC transport system permease protein